MLHAVQFIERLLLARQNLIVGWHDRHIVPGAEWNAEIGDALSAADIVLLLVSKAFMSSRYVNEFEIPCAMQAHEEGRVRVVPVLLEEVDGWEQAPFARLQILPSGALPITQWDDPVAAFRDIARGVRKVAKDIIVAGGGPFEFGAHEFTEAELAELPPDARERTASGLERLRRDLIATMPARVFESNLIVATWALRNFGRPGILKGPEPEALFYMAQVITSFDLVALQEVDRDLTRLHALMEILGPDWSLLVTDVAPGIKGNRERFAFVYYKPRVEFRNFSSQVVLPAKRTKAGESIPVQQFARPPLVAAFRSGAMDFQVCTAHIVFGGGRKENMAERLDEIRKLGEYLAQRARYERTDLYLLGDFQMGKRESPIIDALRESKVELPEQLLHPSNFLKTHYYDLIGFSSPERSMPLGPSRPCGGAYDLFAQVLRDEDRDVFAETRSFMAYRDGMGHSPRAGDKDEKQLKRQYRIWKTFLVSDHLPLWAELTVDQHAED